MTTPVSDVCWVGALGSLIPLPDVAPSSPAQVAVTRVGGLHRSLGGGLTVDTFARKRSWSWSWDLLLEEQVVYLEALQYGTVPGPLRLIDPRRPNRLPEDIATAGSVSGTSRAFSTDNGSVSYFRPLADATTADPASLPSGPMLRGMQEWLIVTPLPENVLRAADSRFPDGRWRVPVLPQETVTLSAWVLGPPDASLELRARWQEASGSFVGVATGPQTATLLGEWVLLEATVQAPPLAGSVTPFLRTDSTQALPSTTFYTTAWQVRSPTMSDLAPIALQQVCEVPELAGGWRIGGGAPYVVADVGTNQYTRPGFFGSTFTLYET